MKKVAILILFVCICALFVGCADTEPDASPSVEGDPIPTSGTYVVAKGYDTSDTGMPLLKPYIVLDADAQTFSFTYDPLSSYLPTGSYTVAENKLTANTDDGKFSFVFDIVDASTLTYNYEESSELPYSTSDVATVAIAHGTRFENTKPSE